MIYLHEQIRLVVGQTESFVDRFEKAYQPLMEHFGARLVGLAPRFPTRIALFPRAPRVVQGRRKSARPFGERQDRRSRRCSSSTIRSVVSTRRRALISTIRELPGSPKTAKLEPRSLSKNLELRGTMKLDSLLPARRARKQKRSVPENSGDRSSRTRS